MPRSKLFPLAIVLLGVVAALIFWPEKDSILVEASEDNVIVAEEASSDLGLATATPDAKVAAIANESNRIEGLASATESNSKAIHPQYEGEDAITITAIDGITHQSMGDAAIYILSVEEWRKERSKLRRNNHARTRVALLHKFGTRFQTDANGVLRIQPPAGSYFASAVKGDYVGIVSQYSDFLNDVEISLRLDRAITARVIDAAGEAVAGVLVAIQSTAGSYVHNRGSQRTNAQGATTFRDLCTLIDPKQAGQKFFLRLDVPTDLASGNEIQRVELTEEVYDAEEIVFTLPEAGGVRITILNSKGEISDEGGSVSLSLAESISGSPANFHLVEDVIDGVAEFPFVGLGTSLLVEYQVKDGGNGDGIELVGPLQAGEWIAASITKTDWPYLTGVLLDPDGNPWVESNFRLTVERVYRMGQSNYGSNLKTDSEGRFRYDLPQSTPNRMPKSQRGVATADISGYGKCEASFDFPTEPLPGENDVGVFILSKSHLLISGRVLDEEGNPIPTALVEIQYKKKKEPATGTSLRLSSRQRSIEGKVKRNGEFGIFGEIPDASQYTLQIKADGYQTLTQEITLGQEGLVFRLVDAGVLMGSILLDPGIDHGLFRIQFQQKGKRYERISIQATDNPNLLQLRSEGKSDAPYSLEIETRLGDELLMLDNLFLTPGEELRPPELQPLDLRGKLIQIHIALQDLKGNRIRGNLSIEKERGSAGMGVNGGGATLLSTNPYDKIVLSSEGYISKTILNVTTDQVVTLEKAMKVSVTVPAQFLSYREMGLYLSVLSKEPRTRLAVGEFDKSGRVDFSVPSMGVYEFELKLMDGGDGFFRAHYNFESYDLSIDHAGQVIHLPVNQSKLDAKIDELQKEI
jgi:hypothetical protein